MAPIVIGGEQFTVHHVYGSGPYDYYCKAAHGLANMDHIALIPMVFKSDDFRFGFETANHTLTPSPLDIAVPGFQPTDLLVDKLFADQCLRVQRIGNVAVQPFAFIPQRSEHTKRFANFVGGYPVGAKSWAVYLDHYAHTYLDQDNDPDGPGTTTFAWASGQLMGGGYLQVLFSNEPLWDYFAEQNNGPGSPYSLHGYGAGLTRVEMARARLLVHELCHHLLPSCPDRAPYLGLKGDEHNLPGIMSSMWRQDPLLGNQWVEHFYEVVNGAHLESGPGPYVTWYLRTQLDWLQKHQ